MASFGEELVLLLINNAVLVLLAIAGYRVESARSRREARRQTLEERMKAIRKQWYTLRRFHQSTDDAWVERAHQSYESSPPACTSEQYAILVARGHDLRRAIRDRRPLLGQTFAYAMYSSLGADLEAANRLARGEEPPKDKFENADFVWLERVLDGADHSLLEREETLPDERTAFLEKRKAAQAAASPP